MQTNQEIHIVSFNVPFPPNYGGVIDVFYKIKALAEQGTIINLHCYNYGREQASELAKYCKTVNYYKRPLKFKYFLSRLPFIVYTRSDEQLYHNLKKDTNPILFEGLHTCYFLPELVNNSRKIIVRTHNIEHEYYRELSKKERNWIKKIYFLTESRKLKKYERIFNSDVQIAAITEKDKEYFSTINSKCSYIPAFHPNETIHIQEGKGKYILYHGDLSVNENITTALFIIQNIASQSNHKFILAGRNPSHKIHKLLTRYSNIELISNPDNKQMMQLIKNAHINLLLTWQTTGIKLKLLNALFIGRYCIANKQMTDGTGLEHLCSIQNNSNDIIFEIDRLMKIDFNQTEINKRENTLLKIVNNTDNAQKLINLFSKNSTL